VKVLLFSDIHIARHKQSMDRLEDCLAALAWVCDTARSRGIERLLFLGDLFQDRNKIDVICYQRTFETFGMYPDLRFDLLLGNHDLWYAEKWDVSSVLPLGTLPGVTVIDRPMTTEIGGRSFDWLPFVKNPLKAVDKNFPAGRRAGHVLCAHVAIDGCQLNSAGQVSEVSVEHESDMVKVSADRFGEWSRVFLGHYHAAQHLTDTMEYIGSPLQLNFAEAGQVKHVVILDTDTLAVEYVENTFSPRHLIVREDQLGAADLSNNYVWVKDDLTKFDAYEKSRGVLAEAARQVQFRAAERPAAEVEADTGRFRQGAGTIRQRYVSAVGSGGLDEERLRRLGDEICEGET
jgi:DNA repair exonuclease SbcCD nuclease subunit